LWFCNDCKLGGTVIDWVMREKGCDAAQAIRELGGGGNDKEELGQIVCAYDYTDEGGKVIFQSAGKTRNRIFRCAGRTDVAIGFGMSKACLGFCIGCRKS